MKRALVVQGGWEGHEPYQVGRRFGQVLDELGFAVDLAESLDVFADAQRMEDLALIVPSWTMGEISKPQLQGVLQAVADGAGMAGCHGGMCDAFRASTEWQFLTGGQWVAHPGGADVTYRVEIRRGSSPIVAGMDDFTVTSEQYYMHVDPVVEVLATTRFPTADGPHVSNGAVDVPVVWTKRYGRGRIFYSSLGHQASVFDQAPALELMRRGFAWAAREAGGGPLCDKGQGP